MAEVKTIWHVEDDADIARFVAESLTEQGFAVEAFSNQSQARAALLSARPDVLLVDWSLPDGSGTSLCRWVRQRDAQLPIMIVTVKDEPADVVAGLQSGADDYVTKPFDLTVLRARIETLMRRTMPEKATIACGNISLDTDSGIVRRNLEPVELTAIELRLLMLFMKNKGRIVSRETIHYDIWESGGAYVSDNALTVAIKRLRDKLGGDLNLKTVRSFGYRLEEPQ